MSPSMFFPVSIVKTNRPSPSGAAVLGDTTSFVRDDRPLVAKVADIAHSWIFEQAASCGKSE